LLSRITFPSLDLIAFNSVTLDNQLLSTAL
jgi:hypothetical protein